MEHPKSFAAWGKRQREHCTGNVVKRNFSILPIVAIGNGDSYTGGYGPVRSRHEFGDINGNKNTYHMVGISVFISGTLRTPVAPCF